MNGNRRDQITNNIKSKLQNVSNLVQNVLTLETELRNLFDELDEEHHKEIKNLEYEIKQLKGDKKSSDNINPFAHATKVDINPLHNSNGINNRKPNKSMTKYNKPLPSYEIPPPPSPNSQKINNNGFHFPSKSAEYSNGNNGHDRGNSLQSPKQPYMQHSHSASDKMNFKTQTGPQQYKKNGIGKMKFSPNNTESKKIDLSIPKKPDNKTKLGSNIIDDSNNKTIKKKGNNIDDIPPGITERDFYKKYWIEAGKIGEGAFARVRRITRKADKQVFALKMIKKKGKTAEDIRALQREITVLQKCDHPNIVRLADWCDTNKRIYMVVEFCDGGDVFERIVQFKKFSEKDAVHVIKQVTSGLGHIHSNKFVHRDLKPDNLMYLTRDANSVIKIIDFGLAGDCSNGPCKTPCGTAHYAAPEVLGNLPYDETADLWSLGVIVYTLLCGFPPFFDASNNMKNLYHLIKKGQFEFPSPFWDDVSNTAKDLIKKLLKKDPKKRLSTDNILKHPWISGGKAPDKDLGNGFVKQMTHWQSTRQATEIKLGGDVPPPPKNSQPIQLYYNQNK